jgi:hypothetical protein
MNQRANWQTFGRSPVELKGSKCECEFEVDMCAGLSAELATESSR